MITPTPISLRDDRFGTGTYDTDGLVNSYANFFSKRKSWGVERSPSERTARIAASRRLNQLTVSVKSFSKSCVKPGLRKASRKYDRNRMAVWSWHSRSKKQKFWGVIFFKIRYTDKEKLADSLLSVNDGFLSSNYGAECKENAFDRKLANGRMGAGMEKSRLFRKLWIAAVWLFLWELVSLLADNSVLMVGPVATARIFLERMFTQGFWQTLLYSFLRIGAGFLAGLGAGILSASFSYRTVWIEETLEPFLLFLKTVPVASFVVLLLIWWGSSFLSMAVSFLVVLPNVYIGILEGLKSTDRKILEMSQVFRLPFRNRLFYLYRPALKPFLNSCMKVSLGMSWKSGVAAEIIGTPEFSLGEKLYLSKVYLDTGSLFAWTAAVVLLSFCFEKAVLWVSRRVFLWEPAAKAPQGGKKIPERRNERGGGKSGRTGGGAWSLGRGILMGAYGSVETGREGAGTGRRDVRAGQRNVETGQEDVRADCKTVAALRKVWKSYGGQQILKEETLECQKGRRYFLTGSSGSGKTTRLRLLAGLEEADRGEVVSCPFQSMVFQEDRLCEDYSAVRNVELVCGSRVRAREQLLRLLPAAVLDKPCSQLSGGMKRRVAVVRGMAAESEAVLLDEPLSGLDEKNRERTIRYILEEQRGRTLVIAMHQMEEPQGFGSGAEGEQACFSCEDSLG